MNVCRQPGCPCSTPVDDENDRPTASRRPTIPGRPMPEGWRARLTAELAARKRERTTVAPPAEQVQ